MSNLGKGAAFENKVKAYLISEGFVAVRSAGSHGLIDVLAVKQSLVLFIQCKTNGVMSNDDRQSLVLLAREHNAIPVLACNNNGKIEMSQITPVFNSVNFCFKDGKIVERDT